MAKFAPLLESEPVDLRYGLRNGYDTPTPCAAHIYINTSKIVEQIFQPRRQRDICYVPRKSIIRRPSYALPTGLFDSPKLKTDSKSHFVSAASASIDIIIINAKITKTEFIFEIVCLCFAHVSLGVNYL